MKNPYRLSALIAELLRQKIGDAFRPPGKRGYDDYVPPSEKASAPPLEPKPAPMNADRIKHIQSRTGTTADGFWGPKSIAAVQAHLRKLMAASGREWPDASQASLARFYGAPGDESRLTRIELPPGTCYAGRPVHSTRVHAKCAASLSRVLQALAATHPQILAQYAGVFNDRTMRGSSTPSLHARGAAIDLAPDTNANKQAWPVSADMPLEVMEAFAREGWLAAGAFWGRDAMHFQATAL